MLPNSVFHLYLTRLKQFCKTIESNGATQNKTERPNSLHRELWNTSTQCNICLHHDIMNYNVFAQKLSLEVLPYSTLCPRNISLGKQNKSSGLAQLKHEVCHNDSDCSSTLLNRTDSDFKFRSSEQAKTKTNKRQKWWCVFQAARAASWGPVEKQRERDREEDWERETERKSTNINDSVLKLL